MARYIRFDWAIKRLLRDKANHEVLEGFLESLPGERYTIALRETASAMKTECLPLQIIPRVTGLSEDIITSL